MAYEIDPISSRLGSIDAKLGTLDTDVRSLKTDVGTLRNDVISVKSSAFMAKLLLGGLFALSVAAGGAVVAMGRSWVAEISRQVVREELAYRSTAVQLGKFTADNRLPDDPRSYAWALKLPVDPKKLTMLSAEPLTSLPGIAVSAKLSDDGKQCIMTLHGDDKVLAALPDVIDAKVTISTRQ